MLKKAMITFFAAFGFSMVGLSGQSLASSSTQIGMVSGGDIYVKSGGTQTAWATRLTSGENATQLKMAGTRVAFVDGSGNLFLKDGLSGQWYEEMSNVSSYALTETGLLVVQAGNNGDVWYKGGENPTGAWDSNLLATGGSKVYLSSNQMMIIENPGTLLGKALTAAYETPWGFGPDSQWLVLAQNATSAALSDNLLTYVDNQGQSFVKVGGINNTWFSNSEGGQMTAIDNRVVQVWASGTLYCALLRDAPTNDDAVACKDDRALGADESQVFAGSGANVHDFVIGTDVLVAYGNMPGGTGDTLYGADYVDSASSTGFGGYTFNVSTWNSLSTTGTEIAAN